MFKKIILSFTGTLTLTLLWLLLLFISYNNIDAHDQCLHIWELSMVTTTITGLAVACFWIQCFVYCCCYKENTPDYMSRGGICIFVMSWCVGLAWSLYICYDFISSNNDDTCLEFYKQQYIWLYVLGWILFIICFALPFFILIITLLFHVCNCRLCRDHESHTQIN